MNENASVPGQDATERVAGFLRFLWMPSPNQLEFTALEAPDQVLARLESALASSEEFAGRVRGNGVQIVRRRAFARNRGGFSPVFYGAVQGSAGRESEGGGSRLIGHFQLHPVSRLFVLAWLGLSILLALALLILGLVRATPESAPADALPFVAPVLLPLIGLAVVRWQQRRGREDEAAVRAWLEKIIRNS